MVLTVFVIGSAIVPSHVRTTGPNVAGAPGGIEYLPGLLQLDFVRQTDRQADSGGNGTVPARIVERSL